MSLSIFLLAMWGSSNPSFLEAVACFKAHATGGAHLARLSGLPRDVFSRLALPNFTWTFVLLLLAAPGRCRKMSVDARSLVGHLLIEVPSLLDKLL